MTNTFFGDFETADAWDTDPTIDPAQVARRLHRYRRAVSNYTGGEELASFDELSRRAYDEALELGIAITAEIVAGDYTPLSVGRAVHESRRARSLELEWDLLDDDERQIGVDLMAMIIDWLQREGPR